MALRTNILLWGLLLTTVLLQFNSPFSFHRRTFHQIKNQVKSSLQAPPVLRCSSTPQLLSNGATLGDFGTIGTGGLDGLTCVGCLVLNEDNLIDNDLTNFATITLPAGQNQSGYTSVKYDQTFPTGTKAGFVLGANPSLTNLQDNLVLTSYLDGVAQQSFSNDDLQVVGGTDVSAVFCQPFNELRVEAKSVVDIVQNYQINQSYVNEIAQYPVPCGLAASTNEICNDCIDNDGNGLVDDEDEDCGGSGLASSNSCGNIPQITTNGATLCESGTIGNNGLACNGCLVLNQDNIIDNDLTNFTTITLPAGVNQIGYTCVKYDQVFSAGTRAGFLVSDIPALPNLEDNLVLRSYLNGVEQQVLTANDIKILDEGLDGKNVSAILCQPFNELRLEAKSVADVVQNYNINHSFVNEVAQFPVPCGSASSTNEICNDCIDNDGDGLVDSEDDNCSGGNGNGGSTTSNNTSSSCQAIEQITTNGATLGSSGIDAPSVLGVSLCVGCSVEDEENLLDNDLDNFATISFPIGVTGSGYVSVQFGQEFPAGKRAGFALDVNGGLIGLLNGLTLTSYRNGIEQEVFSDGDLINVIGIGASDRIDAVYCQPFDELRLTVSSTVGVGKIFQIRYASVDENALFPVPCNLATASAEICDDCIDNDGDGLLDTEDDGCGVPSFSAPSIIETNENETGIALDLNALDDISSEGNGLTYAFTNDPTNSPDENLFTINPTTGEITFNNPPDYENPLDSNGDNIYQFEVAVTDSNNLTSTMIFDLTITDTCETTPVLLSYE